MPTMRALYHPGPDDCTGIILKVAINNGPNLFSDPVQWTTDQGYTTTMDSGEAAPTQLKVAFSSDAVQSSPSP